ncbi:hypothetical protein TWF730_006779 [Orbilia blumenaviensis]|uniref:B-block binding subunit of TFIIIC domain-containing protein n=1 Tax=Orbilia blumenaviensis TaxID=1796055 RepID=A0AAV9VGH0_9PEZI
MADTGELLEIIKDECALTVTQGLPVTSVWKLVTDYLEKDETLVVPLEILDPTIPNLPTAYYPPQPLDESLRQTIWELIQHDSEISIGIENEGKDLCFDDAEAGIGAEGQPIVEEQPPGWRLYASESLQWKRIAGHDIDKIRLFPTLWELLKIIAMNREDGILQPALTAQSGQDARSVGPRTKDLAGKGYIMKIPVMAPKMRTSKLILKRFYKGAVEKRKTQKKKRMDTIKEHAKAGKKPPRDAQEEPLDIEEVIKSIMKLLKSAKNKVMLVEDLKFRLNCTSTRSRRKACRRILAKLESMGCLQKIRALGSQHAHAEKFNFGPVGEDEVADLKGARFSKCVKFIRDLRPLEWPEAVKGVRPAVTQDEEDDLDEVDSDDEQDDGYRVIRTAPLVRVVNGRRVIVPLWRKTQLMHVIYDQVLAAGIEGIRSGLLSGAVFGPFYYRPFDQIMGRWTTNSLLNQPDHLKSTSLVRETDLYKKTANYRYWTTEHFQGMLEEKQIDYAAADAAANPFKIGQKKKKFITKTGQNEDDGEEPGALDQNGFGKVNSAAFVHADGRGSFQDCQNAAPKKGSGLRPPGVSPLKGRKRVKREPCEPDETDKPKKKRKIPRKSDVAEPQEEEPEPTLEDEAVVIIGRKRKYPPGTEPYLKEKPRLDAVKKALRLGSIKEVLADGTLINPKELPEGFQPLSTIEEDSWTIEMIAERTFLDLVGLKPYQIPLATERYRSTHAKKGRPRKSEAAPELPPLPPSPTSMSPPPPSTQVFQLFQLGPILQPGPNGLVELAVEPEPKPEPPSKPAKRAYKRRKTDNNVDLPAGEASAAPETITMAEQSINPDGPAVLTAETPKPQNTPRAKRGKAQGVTGTEPDDAVTKPTPKRKANSKDTPKKSSPPKKIKTAGGKTADSGVTDAIEAEGHPIHPGQKTTQDAPTQAKDNVEGGLGVNLASPRMPPGGRILPSARTTLVDLTSTVDGDPEPDSRNPKPDREPSHSTASQPEPLPMEIDTESPAKEGSNDETRKGDVPQNGNSPLVVDLEAALPGPSNDITQAGAAASSTEDVLPKAPELPKLKPVTDDNGIRLELVPAAARKNRSIGGVLKANRRRLLMDLLTSTGGAISVNAGYRRFVEYIREHTDQTSKMDRKTFNSIIEDTNRDGKLFLIGVFKNTRRLGTIIATMDTTLQDEKVQKAKKTILEELDKPFAWKQNVSKGMVPKTVTVPIERIDFQRYSYASKAAALGNSGTRRRLDDEKMSTLARLQAITESEKKEKAAAKKGKKRSTGKSQPITSRTRSKANGIRSSPYSDADSEVEGFGSGDERARRGGRHRQMDDGDSDPDVPGDTLHRWQVPRVDPNTYPEHTTNFPPYTIPEAGKIRSGRLGTYEDYAAASAARNQTGAVYGTLDAQEYEKIRPRRRQQAGGRAAKPLVRPMMTNEREINPDLEPLVAAAPRKRGKKTKEPASTVDPKAVKERKPKPKAVRLPRPKDVPRIRTTLEEDETLALAVIIIRTLFGGYVRSIKWDLVAKALPSYDRWSIQTHWPRVRAKMKDEIPQYQSEFEEQYLRYFYKRKLPFFDKNRGVDFDLVRHVNWLRPLVKNIRPVTERRILPDTRDSLEALYEISSTPLDWRRDFFNYMTTMSWKEHQLKNHSSSAIMEEEAATPVPEKRRAVERAKYAWRSIFVTEDDKYDDKKAKELIKTYPQAVSAAALTELHKVDRFIIRSRKGGRYGTATAQARVLQPWRTTFSTQAFDEAKDFYENVVVGGGLLRGKGECRLVSTALTTGSMAWLLDRVVRGEVDLYTKDYKTTSRGLAESLVTRAINPILFHFDIFLARNGDHMIERPVLEPAGLYDEVPKGSMKDVAFPPFIWQNMHDEVIGYMWERVVRCVLAVVVAKPGVTTRMVVKALQGVVNVRDVVNAVRWLEQRGGVVEKVEGRYWGGREYLWSSAGAFSDIPAMFANHLQTVAWHGNLIAIEHNPDLEFLDSAASTYPEFQGAFCLYDGAALDSTGEHEPVGVREITNPKVIWEINNKPKEQYDPNRWREEVKCLPDHDNDKSTDGTMWGFIGSEGKEGELINYNPFGVALHDYALGQLQNKRTKRCLAIVRDKEADEGANIETVPHAVRSEKCDYTGRDPKQLWVFYFQSRDQPFGPFVPAMYTGACWGPNIYDEGNNATTVKAVKGAVYKEYTMADHLRLVDSRYVALSTFDRDDGGGISPVVRCTGQKWFFNPPFEDGEPTEFEDEARPPYFEPPPNKLS